MPRYFFDCHDGKAFQPDVYGIEITNDDEAAVQGACLARTLVTEVTDSFGPSAVTVVVRSDGGSVVYTAHCSFQGLQMPDQDQLDAIRRPCPAES